MIKGLIAILFAATIAAIIYGYRPPPDIEDLLHAYNVNYYTDAVHTKCGTETAEVRAFTCGEEIYLVQPWFSDLPVGVQFFVLAHEQGHQADTIENEQLIDEQYADCYAGFKLGLLDEIDIVRQQDIAVVRRQLAQWGSESHGTAEIRWTAVMNGYVEQTCSRYNLPL